MRLRGLNELSVVLTTLIALRLKRRGSEVQGSA